MASVCITLPPLIQPFNTGQSCDVPQDKQIHIHSNGWLASLYIAVLPTIQAKRRVSQFLPCAYAGQPGWQFPDGHDSLRVPGGRKLRGDREHAALRRPRPQHQQQARHQPGPRGAQIAHLRQMLAAARSENQTLKRQIGGEHRAKPLGR